MGFFIFNRTFCKQTVETLVRWAASDLGLHCLPMAHKKDAIWHLLQLLHLFQGITLDCYFAVGYYCQLFMFGPGKKTHILWHKLTIKVAMKAPFSWNHLWVMYSCQSWCDFEPGQKHSLNKTMVITIVTNQIQKLGYHDFQPGLNNGWA